MPTSERRTEQRGLSAWASLLDDRMPLLKYFGFAFWVAWFGVAYTSSVWVERVESTASVVSDMFFASTIAHAVTLLAFAAFSRKTSRIANRTWFVLGSGVTAAAGCVLVLAAGPAYLQSRVVFSVGCVLTGMGTAALSLNAGLLLCSLRPRRALSFILYCEMLAALVQFMVFGLPRPYSAALFVALPFVSAACLAVGTLKRAVPAVSESERLKPVRTFYRFLFVVGILSVAANFDKGIHQALVSPEQLSVDGSITTFATVVCLVVLAVVVALKSRDLNFGHLFYPMALILILCSMVAYFFPDGAGVGVVLSSVAFQLFDVVMWYIFAYIVYQSKASAVLVVGLGRAVIAFGVTAGNSLGSMCAALDANALPMSTVVFVILFAATVAVFFIFPEKQVDRLLLPIPDEDEPQVMGDGGERGTAGVQDDPQWDDGEDDGAGQGAGEGVGSGSRSGASSVASSDGSPAVDADVTRHGRWKRLCLQLGDEAQLTEREKEVLVMLARGYGSQSISDALTVSLYTTRAHTRNIYAKLDVHSRQELADRVRAYVEAREG